MRLSKTLFATLPFLFFTIAITIINLKNKNQWKTLAKNLIKHDANSLQATSIAELTGDLAIWVGNLTNDQKETIKALLLVNQNDSTFLATLENLLDPAHLVTAQLDTLAATAVSDPTLVTGLADQTYNYSPSDIVQVKAQLSLCDNTVPAATGGTSGSCGAPAPAPTQSCRQQLDDMKNQVTTFITTLETKRTSNPAAFTDSHIVSEYTLLKDNLVTKLAGLQSNTKIDAGTKLKAQNLEDDLNLASSYPADDATNFYELLKAMLPLFQ